MESLPIYAVAVVLAAFVGVAEDFIRLVNFFEFSFGFFIVGVRVRVVLPREAAKCFFYFVRLCGASDAKSAIIVFGFHAREGENR